MQLLTVDGGGLVSKNTPKTPTMGVLYPGERMDMLLLAEDEDGTEEHVLNTDMTIVLDPE